MTEQTKKDIDRAFKALEERNELLDKIRAEIAEQASCNGFFNDGIERALEIIDKYAEV
jgi:hypothetical protein